MSENEADRTRYIASKVSFAGGVERFARSDPAFATTSEFWDRDAWLLGTPSGVIDLRTGDLRPGKPDDGITRCTVVAPASTAACPLWVAFLDQTTGGDTEKVRFLRQWFGYCLTGLTIEHALVFVFGPGGNGKSVYLNVKTGIMGDYAATATMYAVIASHGDRRSTDLAMLRGARLVTANETERGRQWAEGRIKQLTGGDPITARFMRQDNFTFKPQFKLAIVWNHKPSLRTVDDAQRRRFNLVPFTRKPASPDRQLEAKLRAEWPAILRWAVEGCLDWQANGLVRPSSVVEATRAYFADQDLMAHWLAEECDAEPGNTWKSESNEALLNPGATMRLKLGTTRFAEGVLQELERSDFQKHKGTGGKRCFLGLRLKTREADSGG